MLGGPRPGLSDPAFENLLEITECGPALALQAVDAKKSEAERITGWLMRSTACLTEGALSGCFVSLKQKGDLQ